jgi:hypothetical protein
MAGGSTRHAAIRSDLSDECLYWASKRPQHVAAAVKWLLALHERNLVSRDRTKEILDAKQRDARDRSNRLLDDALTLTLSAVLAQLVAYTAETPSCHLRQRNQR